MDIRTSFDCGFIILQIKATAKLQAMILTDKINSINQGNGDITELPLLQIKLNHAMSIMESI